MSNSGHSVINTSNRGTGSSNSRLTLSSLPQVIFILICSFLTLEDKVLSLVQVCHSVNGCFSPACFCFTTHAIGKKQARALRRRSVQNPTTRRLLSLIPSVECHVADSAALLYFTHLIKLSFDVDNFFNAKQSFPHWIDTNPCLFHHLTEVAFPHFLPPWPFSAERFPRLTSIMVLTPYWSSTGAQLPRLKDLLCLPTLTSLNIHNLASRQSEVLPAMIQHIPWKQLVRLTVHETEWKHDHHEHLIPSLLQQAKHIGAPGWPLQELTLHGSASLPKISALLNFVFLLFPSLVTLDLSGLTLYAGSMDFRDISSRPQTSLLFLRHVLLPICSYRVDESDYQATLDLLVSVADSLTVLGYNLFFGWQFNHHPSFLQQVFSMTSLHKLSISGKSTNSYERGSEKIFARALIGISLPNLHTLSLHDIIIGTQTMETLLKRTPHLVDVTIEYCILASEVIPLIAIYCRCIRSIRVSQQSGLHWTLDGCVREEHKQQLMQCLFIPFSTLQLLLLHCFHKDTSAYPTTGLTDLLELCHAAPLISIGFRGSWVTCEQLMLFARFKSLRSLDMDVTACSDVCLHGVTRLCSNKYTTETPYILPNPSITEEIPPISELREGSEQLRPARFFRQSVIPGHEHANRQGREAFFHDLQPHVQQGCRVIQQGSIKTEAELYLLERNYTEPELLSTVQKLCNALYCCCKR